MGLNLGRLLRNAGTLGTTWMRDQKRAKKKKKKAEQVQAQALADAEQFRDRDLGQTAFNGVRADSAMVAAQQQSLGRMQDVAREGYTDVDRQAMQSQLNDAARYEQSQRQSLAADARARGVSGSGMDIMSQLAAQQAGADRATQTATDMAIAGRDRSYQANADAGAMAGQMRGQGFSEQAQVAGAQDQYAQWRAGTQAQDLDRLQAARGIQAGNLQQQAGALEATPNLDVAANAVANYYSAGQAGNVAGPSNAVGAPGAGSAKSLSAAPPTGGGATAPYPSGAPQQKATSPITGGGAPMQKAMPRTPAAPVANAYSAGAAPAGGATRPPGASPNVRRAASPLVQRMRGSGLGARPQQASRPQVGANPFRRLGRA